MKMKIIDIKSENEVKVSVVRKKNLIKDIIDKETVIVVESKKSKYSYMIFAFQKIQEKYGINYDTIIVVMYLNELDLFSNKITIENRVITLTDYVRLGLVVKEHKVSGKNLYKLTERSKEILSEFNDLVKNSSQFISENRTTEIGVDSKVSDVLSKYFNR